MSRVLRVYMSYVKHMSNMHMSNVKHMSNMRMSYLKHMTKVMVSRVSGLRAAALAEERELQVASDRIFNLISWKLICKWICILTEKTLFQSKIAK